MRLHFDDIVFDSDARSISRAGSPVHLSGKAFLLLEILLTERPNPVRKEILFERLWPDTFVSEANLASLVKEVRAALGDDARNPRYVRTAHRFGYAFTADVGELPREARPIGSIAVLRFENLSGTADCDYLAEGIAETLINTLSSVGALRVAPRSASFRFSGEDDPKTLQRELNVRAALTGRLRLIGGDVSLHVELIDLATQSHLWGNQFRRSMSDLFTLQEELSREVIAHLRLRLSGDAERKLSKRYTASNEAYQLYLKGRHHWNRRTAEGIERGIFYFQSAIERDGEMAPAYSGLADSYIALASRDLFPPTQLFPKAEEAARNALRLDPDLAEAHASLGAINEIFRWNWPDAERELTAALRLNPSYATARMWYGQLLAHRGRFGEALSQFSIASENDPLSFMLNTQIAVVHYLAREFDRCEQMCLKALEINPHHEPAHFTLGLAHEQRGAFAEARNELEKALAISRGEPHVEAALGHLAATVGDRTESGARLEHLKELSATRYVSPVHFAIVDVAAGELDRAMALLREAAESRAGWLVFARTEPRLDPVRNDSRFSELLGLVDGK